ncbi:endolytic transglycosylase MltG [Acidisoma sp. C75]
MPQPRIIGRLAAWILPLFVLLTVLNAGRMYIDQTWSGPGPLPKATDVVVPPGDSRAVGRALQAAHVIDGLFAFRVAEFVTRGQGPLHAGEFRFPAHGSLADAFRILRHGKPVEHQLTIPEGLTAKDIKDLINAAPAMTGRVTLAREGAILPNTYDYLYGTKRSALLARAEQALTAAMAKAWPDRAPGLPITSPEQAITLASIVERETAIPAERPMVAAVYLNRLAAGMKLQADPTVIYGLSDGRGVLPRPLDHADLLVPGAYNTYLNAGLPPGPIAAPGIAAILAVLHPAKTDALYFVANGTGGHSFSATYQGQEKNVARLRRLDAARLK